MDQRIGAIGRVDAKPNGSSKPGLGCAIFVYTVYNLNLDLIWGL